MPRATAPLHTVGGGGGGGSSGAVLQPYATVRHRSTTTHVGCIPKHYPDVIFCAHLRRWCTKHNESYYPPKEHTVVKDGEGLAQEASTRGAVHLIKKLPEMEQLLQAKRPNVPCSSQPRFLLPFLLQLSSRLQSTHLGALHVHARLLCIVQQRSLFRHASENTQSDSTRGWSSRIARHYSWAKERKY